jgi:hypothetical protein
MPVEVPEQMVDVLCGGRVAVPLSNVKAEESFISVSLRLCNKLFQVAVKVCDEICIKIFPEKVCCSTGSA